MKYERIQDLREENFWTQSYVAHKLHVSQRTYSYYERGEHNIPAELLVSIAHLYGVSIDYLLNNTDTRKPYPRSRKRAGAGTVPSM